MNIGMVLYPTFGGSGVVATELGMQLAAAGHTVHFISYDRPARLMCFSDNIFYQEVRPQNYPLFEFTPYESALVSKIVDVAQTDGLDILHVHYALPHASSAYMARSILKHYGCDLPFITTLHGTDITIVGKDASYKPIVEFSINQSNIITTVSESLRKDTYENFRIENDILVVPNFIDLARFNEQATHAFRDQWASQGEQVLIHVSNFRPVKRVWDTYEVFKRLRQEKKVRMLYVGDGPLRPKIADQVREDGYAAEVMFLGKQEVIEHILPMGDVFLMPSENESFGLAALEAMAAGLPVVATDTGGLPELIEHGKSGYLAPVGDVDQLTAYTRELLARPATLRNFSANALARAREFDLHNIVPLYEDCYNMALEGVVPCR